MENTHSNPSSSSSTMAGLFRFLHQNRIFRPATFGLIIFLFSFSFMDIQCSGQKVGTMTGMDFVLGNDPSLTEAAAANGMNVDEQYEGSPDIWAILALVGAILGTLTFFLQRNEQMVNAFCITAGIMGITGIQMLRRTWPSSRAQTGDIGAELIEVSFTGTYWLVVMLFYLLTAISVWRLVRPQKVEPAFM